MKQFPLFVLGMILLCLSGCVQYPLGLSQQQWQSLPPEKQAEYQAKQYQIDKDRQQQAEQARQQRSQQAATAARMEQERINALYANARYGDIVNVIVRGGAMKWNNETYPCEPLSFDLVRGETKEVEFRGRADNVRNLVSRYPVQLSEDGHTLYFNSESPNRITLVDDGWERGRTYPVTGHTLNEVTVGMSGMTISVKYKDMSGAPQRLIIEHR